MELSSEMIPSNIVTIYPSPEPRQITHGLNLLAAIGLLAEIGQIELC